MAIGQSADSLKFSHTWEIACLSTVLHQSPWQPSAFLDGVDWLATTLWFIACQDEKTTSHISSSHRVWMICSAEAPTSNQNKTTKTWFELTANSLVDNLTQP